MKKELDQQASEIEFLLISVVQGLALQMLAVSALEPISMFRTEYWFYIVSAFILILVFWSQAIMHALSFIDWPIDLVHTFLYFLASFFEVIVFNQITHPLKWYLFGSAFLLIAGLLYAYDLFMIRRHRSEFIRRKEKKKLYNHMYTQQIKEMKLFLPAALLYNVLAAFLIFRFPQMYIGQNYHILLAGVQTIGSVFLLLNTIGTFKLRSAIIDRM